MASASEPSRKRARTEASPAVAPQSSTENEIRRGIPWLEDGNIVLQAENTQFRVHKSILTAHSDVFRDMFMMPQPPITSGDMVDGCSIVVMPDSAGDIGALLNAMLPNL
jgi:hypothetical protein